MRICKGTLCRYLSLMITRRILSRTRRIATVAAVFLAFNAPAFAEPAEVSELAASASAPVAAAQVQPLAVVTLPPPAVLSEKFMTVARKIMPGPQTEMMPMFLLGQFGYPAFNGFSAEDPVVIHLFKNEAGPVSVAFLARMSADSPVRAQLAQMYAVQDIPGGWTLIQQGGLKLPPSALDSMIAVARKPRGHDLELKVQLDGVKVLLREQLAAASDAADQKIRKEALDLLLTEFDALQDLGLSLDFGKDAISFSLSAKAAPRSPLGAVFSTKSGGPVPAAQFVQNKGAIVFASRYDAQSFVGYLRHLSATASKAGLADFSRSFDELLKTADLQLKNMDGTTAGSITYENGIPVTVSLCGGAQGNEKLLESLRAQADSTNTFFGRHLKAFQKGLPELDMRTALKENAFSVDGTPVHQIVSTVTAPVPTPDGQKPQSGATEQSYEIAGTKQILNSGNYFVTSLGGYTILASKQDQMRASIAAVKAGKPVEGNVATTIQLKEGEAVKAYIRIPEIMLASEAGMDPTGAGVEKMRRLSEAYRALAPEPISLSLTTSPEAHVEYHMDIPVDALAKLRIASERASRPETPATPTGSAPTTSAK